MAPDDFPAGGYLSDYLAFWAIWLVLVAGTWAFLRRSRGRTGRGRVVAGNALVLASLLWTLVLGAETWLRYVHDASDQWGLTLTNFAWGRRHFHPNSTGMRDREFSGKRRPGVTRIACVGDSFTMAWGVPDAADAWPQRLGALLEERAPGRFETLNLGVAGWQTRQEADYVEATASRGLYERVIVGYCLNDPDEFLPAARQFDKSTLPRPAWIAPWRSFLLDFLWFRLRLQDDPRVRGYFDWEIEAYQDKAIWAKQCEQFGRLAAACRRAGVGLDVVVFPFFNDLGEHYRFDVCHDRVAEAWRALGVSVIDLRAAYRGIPAADLVVNRFDAHPNERAHDLAARAAADRIVPPK